MNMTNTSFSYMRAIISKDRMRTFLLAMIDTFVDYLYSGSNEEHINV